MSWGEQVQFDVMMMMMMSFLY